MVCIFLWWSSKVYIRLLNFFCISTDISASWSKTFLTGVITWKDHFPIRRMVGSVSALVSECVAEMFAISLPWLVSSTYDEFSYWVGLKCAKVWPLMMFSSSGPMFTTKSGFLSTSFSGNIHIVGIMYKERLSIHKNRFHMIFAILSFVPEVLRMFVPFVRTTVIVQGGRSMFVLLINLASLPSAKNSGVHWRIEFGISQWFVISMWVSLALVVPIYSSYNIFSNV